MMNAYTLILILTTEALAYNSNEGLDYNWPNVGSVLFYRSDLTKNRWTKTEVALLQARQYFQSMIPAPEMVNPSRDFVDKLISYFRDAYSAIQRHATCPEVDSILTTALSDTIGGYLKLWILPVTKFAFYGGAISKENVYRLFNLYNEVKMYLRTDGEGWRSPDDNILRLITIGIQRTPHLAFTRSFGDPCENFAYFEKTPFGFTVPIPYINWDGETMFVPLRNQSLIPLGSSRYHNILMRYYNAAKSCLKSRSPNVSSDFDDKFQIWLSKDVVPHLADENLYVALGSVLSLLNRTNLYNIDQTFLNQEAHSPYRDVVSTIMSYIPICCRSKKTLIVGVILLLEVIWCLCALQHVSSKKRSESIVHCCHSLMLFFKSNLHNKDETVAEEYMELSGSAQNIYTGSVSDVVGGGVKLHQSPRYKRIVDTVCQRPSTTISIKGAVGTDACSCVVINEGGSKKSLLKCPTKSVTGMDKRTNTALKITTSKTENSSKTFTIQQKLCNCKATHSAVQTTCMKPPEKSMIKTEHSTIITLFKKCKKKFERAIFNSNENAARLERNLCDGENSKSKLEVLQKSTASCLCADYGVKCSCINCKVNKKPSIVGCSSEAYCSKCICYKNNNKCICSKSDATKHSQDKTEVRVCTLTRKHNSIAESQKTETVTQTVVMCVDKQTGMNVENLQKAQTINMHEIKSLKLHQTKTKELKKNSHQPYLEIKIDKPNTEISVGITGFIGKLDQTSSPKSAFLKDKSKIPKRKMTFPLKESAPKDKQTAAPSTRVACSATVQPTNLPRLRPPASLRSERPHVQQRPAPNPKILKAQTKKEPSRKSMIPQLKKRTVDDIFIKNKEAMIKDSKLNVTL